MTLPGHKPVRVRPGIDQVRAFLTEVQQVGGLVRVEDDHGREVPSSLDSVTAGEVTLTPQRTLDLTPGRETQLVLICFESRFKAAARVLHVHGTQVRVALPHRIREADRRTTSRGFLNVALWGLFSPLAVAATPPEPTTYFEYEAGRAAAQWVQVPQQESPDPSPASSVPSRPLPSTPGLVLGNARAHPVVDYLQDRLQSRLNSLYARHVATPQPWLGMGGNPIRQKHDSGLLGHGCSFHFLPISAPDRWHASRSFNTMRFEVHVDRNNVQLGIRIK